MKCTSMMLMRVQQMIEQNDPKFTKSLRELAFFFEVADYKLELLIDSIYGNPLDIFKVQNKRAVNYTLGSK